MGHLKFLQIMYEYNSISPYQSVSYTKSFTTKTDSNLANTFSISQSTKNVQEANSPQANPSNILERVF